MIIKSFVEAPWHGGPIRDGFVTGDVFDNYTCTCNLHLAPLAEKSPLAAGSKIKSTPWIVFVLLLLLLSCQAPIGPERIVVKTLVEDTPNPDEAAVRLRWSFDPKAFDAKKKNLRLRFPECGFLIFRKDPGNAVFHEIGEFKLPETEVQLKNQISHIPDEALKNRLLTSANTLSQEGKNLFTAIKASREGKKEGFPADPTNLLMLASMDPNMAQILGLIHTDIVNKNGKFLFSVDSKFQSSLEQGTMHWELRQEFKANTFTLSSFVVVSPVEGSQWVINDEGNQNKYFIRKEGHILKVYNNTYTYKIVGGWDWGSGCIPGPQDETIISVQAIADPPLEPPGWADEAGLAKDSLLQIKQIEFTRANQKITYHDAAGLKQQTAPPALPLEDPVVEIIWEKSNDDYIGYHIDRWKIDQYHQGLPPTRVNVFPKFLFRMEIKKTPVELDSGNIPQELFQAFKNKKRRLSPGSIVRVKKKGSLWFITDATKNQTYIIEKEEGHLIISELSPFLLLSQGDRTQEVPENYLDAFKLEAEETYVYKITAVDIFGRRSEPSFEKRSITLVPLDFPPIPPQRVCLESFDLESGGLRSKSCPKKTPGSPTKMTWVSAADLNQKPGTQELGIRIKWLWTFQQQKKYRADFFNIYRNTAPFKEDQVDDDADGRLNEEFPNHDDDDGDGRIDEDLLFDGEIAVEGLALAHDQEIYEHSFPISTEDLKTGKKKPVMYYYYCITTVSPQGQSGPSVPLTAYVVDKITPKMPPAPCEQDAWVEITVDETQSPDWEGKLAIKLDWEKFEQRLRDERGIDDIDGYHLYRAIDKPGAEYVRLNQHLIELTTYIDRIEARARNTFYYKLQVVDQAGNTSTKSDPSCPVELPDRIPPKPVVIAAVSGGNEQITIEWEPSSSSDAVGYYLYRGTSRKDVETRSKDPTKRLNPSLLTVPQIQNNKKIFIYPDGPGLEAGKDFYYIVETVDQKGNCSFSLPAAGRAYDITPPLPPTNLDAKVKTFKPFTVKKENALIRITRITPSRIGAGQGFPVEVIVQVKKDRVEYVSVSEDPREGLRRASGNLYTEWFKPVKNATLRFDYELRAPTPSTTPSICRILGTIKAAEPGITQKLELESSIEVAAGGTGERVVELSWKLPEKDARAAIWRCEAETCDESKGTWKMIAPLQPANQTFYQDSEVQKGKTYYYKIQVFDKIGNKGKFSKILKVIVN